MTDQLQRNIEYTQAQIKRAEQKIEAEPMSDTSPIYKDPLTWWTNHLAELERIVQYMDEQGIPVPESDRVMVEKAREYVTKFVIDKLESGNAPD